MEILNRRRSVDQIDLVRLADGQRILFAAANVFDFGGQTQRDLFCSWRNGELNRGFLVIVQFKIGDTFRCFHTVQINHRDNQLLIVQQFDGYLSRVINRQRRANDDTGFVAGQ